MSLLTLSNVETLFGSNHALRGVSLNVKAGSVTAILGSNGAGKTTILKTTMGLLDDQPDKGTITFNGPRISGKETEDIVRLGLSFVPEGREVFDELTVDENLRMGAYIRRDRQGINTGRVCVFLPGYGYAIACWHSAGHQWRVDLRFPRPKWLRQVDNHPNALWPADTQRR